MCEPSGAQRLNQFSKRTPNPADSPPNRLPRRGRHSNAPIPNNQGRWAKMSLSCHSSAREKERVAREANVA